MYVRAIAAFLMLPGVFMFAVPVVLAAATGPAQIVQPLGLIPVGIGLAGALWCARDFYVRGKGTPAPWMPPTELVIAGLYRYTRNPMYVSGVLIVTGWAIAFGSLVVAGYAVLMAVAFHLRVVQYEEPVLARTFGPAWDDYARRVPRWLW